MSPRQISLVQSSLSQILTIGMPVARRFYARLFEIDPSLRPLFPAEMETQSRKLLMMIATATSHLDRFEEIEPTILALGRRHVAYRVDAGHYGAVGAALTDTPAETLGEDFTPELRSAWASAYAAIAAAMKTGADTALVRRPTRT